MYFFYLNYRTFPYNILFLSRYILSMAVPSHFLFYLPASTDCYTLGMLSPFLRISFPIKQNWHKKISLKPWTITRHKKWLDHMEKEGEIAFIFLIKGNLDKPSLKCTCLYRSLKDETNVFDFQQKRCSVDRGNTKNNSW